MIVRFSIIALALLIALSLLTWAVWSDGRDAGRHEVQAAWDHQRTTDAKTALAVARQARAREQALQAQADRIHQEKTREIAALDRRHAAALDSMRKRPDRPTLNLPATPGAAGAGPAAGCGADQLYRQDAAVALGIARDADIVRVALQQCHAQYEAASDTAASYTSDSSTD